MFRPPGPRPSEWFLTPCLQMLAAGVVRYLFPYHEPRLLTWDIQDYETDDEDSDYQPQESDNSESEGSQGESEDLQNDSDESGADSCEADNETEEDQLRSDSEEDNISEGSPAQHPSFSCTNPGQFSSRTAA